MSVEHPAVDSHLRGLAEAVADGLLRLQEQGGCVIVEPAAEAGAWRLRHSWSEAGEDGALSLGAEAWPHLVPEVDPDSDEGRAWTEAGLRDVLLRSLLRSGQARRLRDALRAGAAEAELQDPPEDASEAEPARRAHFPLEALLNEAALGHSARVLPPLNVDGLHLGMDWEALREHVATRGGTLEGDATEAAWVAAHDPLDRLQLEFDEHGLLHRIDVAPRSLDRLYGAHGLGPRGAARRVMARHRLLRLDVVAAGLSYAWEAPAPQGARIRISPYIKQLTVWRDVD